MKNKIIVILLTLALFVSCIRIPRETITLSQTIGSDLKILQKSHINIIELHFNKIKNDINKFIDDVYAPYVINYVLKIELKKYKDGSPSLYGAIEAAGQKPSKEDSENALNKMSEFVDAARQQIEAKRLELITPIQNQESALIKAVNLSYENVMYANTTITAYLQSVRKVKDAQEEALSMIGLKGADSLTSNMLVNFSNQIDTAIKSAKEIDIKSDDAKNQLEAIIKKLKEITTKK